MNRQLSERSDKESLSLRSKVVAVKLSCLGNGVGLAWQASVTLQDKT